MIRFTVSKREFIYWLSGLTAVPVLLFAAGITFGAAFFIHTPQPVIASSHTPAELARASMLAAIEARNVDDTIEWNTNRPAGLDQTPNIDTPHFEHATATEKSYSVQIGNFSNKKNAASVTKYLRGKGYQVKTLVINEASRAKHHYKVRIGHYPSYTAAAVAAADYRVHEHTAAFVVANNIVSADAPGFTPDQVGRLPHADSHTNTDSGKG